MSYPNGKNNIGASSGRLSNADTAMGHQVGSRGPNSSLEAVGGVQNGCIIAGPYHCRYQCFDRDANSSDLHSFGSKIDRRVGTVATPPLGTALNAFPTVVTMTCKSLQLL